MGEAAGLALLAATLLVLVEVAAFLAVVPAAAGRAVRPGRARRRDRLVGAVGYWLAYGLGVLRVPLALLPYVTKLWLHLGLRLRYKTAASSARLDLLGLAGDGLNLVVGLAVTVGLVGPLRLDQPSALAYLPVLAEGIRLLAERGQMVATALWQGLPHRRWACWLGRSPRARWLARHWPPLGRYRRYYRRTDAARAAFVLRWLRARSVGAAALTERLSYIERFQIVPTSQRLRAGHVRDVADGTIFIHAAWTADPGLLVGLALRRSPWVFDPRHLPRPFHYWTTAGRLTTRLVLDHAHYCPQYAVFQLGHAMQTARHDLFYRLVRRLGWPLEGVVNADGTYTFDPLVLWLERRLGRAPTIDATPEPLWSEARIMADWLGGRVAAGECVAAVARRYTVPRRYVREVLLPLASGTAADLKPTVGPGVLPRVGAPNDVSIEHVS